ncbi:MAG: hypothetical protein OEV45_00945 [Desulfobacteraceae bacterium]|nr:hypothetical protein [Desulfobacteraceae bacterium]
MKLLNIIRSEPDETTKTFIESFSKDEGAKKVVLYEGDIDWSALVDDIFSYDKVVCWW